MLLADLLRRDGGDRDSMPAPTGRLSRGSHQLEPCVQVGPMDSDGRNPTRRLRPDDSQGSRSGSRERIGSCGCGSSYQPGPDGPRSSKLGPHAGLTHSDGCESSLQAGPNGSRSSKLGPHAGLTHSDGCESSLQAGPDGSHSSKRGPQAGLTDSDGCESSLQAGPDGSRSSKRGPEAGLTDSDGCRPSHQAEPDGWYSRGSPPQEEPPDANSSTPTRQMRPNEVCGSESGSQAGRALCPRCGDSRVAKNGSFRLRSGERVQRYLCRACGRTFSPLTGKPAYRLRKRAEWNAMVHLLQTELPLRQTASRLSISLSTAFRWRHRALAYLNRRVCAPLGGDVSVRFFRVKYSEKGSRICNGPGSWGYWNIARRGPEPEWRPRPRMATSGKRRFRLLIEGRPVGVMVAQNEGGCELCILGQGRTTPELFGRGLAQLVKPGSQVFSFGGFRHDFEEACEALGLAHHDGHPSPDRVRVAPLPGSWLRRFKGVATRYLAHYLAWFRDIVHHAGAPGGTVPAECPTLRLLLVSR